MDQRSISGGIYWPAIEVNSLISGNEDGEQFVPTLLVYRAEKLDEVNKKGADPESTEVPNSGCGMWN